MSVNAFVFNQHMNVIDVDNIIHSSLNDYMQGGEGYRDFPANYIEFAPTITSSQLAVDAFVDEVLMTLANKTKLVFHYSLSVNDQLTQYRLKASFRLLNKNGGLIRDGGYSEQTRSWADNYPRKPFSVIYFYPSFVSYNNGVNTVAGDPARTIYICYAFAPLEYVNDLMPFIGSVKGRDFYNNYIDAAGQLQTISSDADWQTFTGQVDGGGDGKPWYEPGDVPEDPDPSEPGGGDRPGGDPGDPVDFPGLPTGSALATGFLSLYNPDQTLLRQLATKLWSNDFFNTIEKVLNDPFDAIIGLSLIPFTPTTSGSVNVMIGNYDSQVSMPAISAQYKTLDCGTLKINENWKNALDYNATSAEIFIPFVGFRPLDIQDVMNYTLALKYNVDVLTGNGVAILKAGNKVLYTWPCNLAYDIPITGSNKQALYTGMINVALTGAGGLASGGVMGGVMGAANSAINTATHAQSDVQRSGSIVSNTSMLSDFTPYVILHRPKQSMPQNFKQIKGYQSNMTRVLGTLSGYTEVDFIHLTGISGATDTELQEIEQLLKNGVII